MGKIWGKWWFWLIIILVVVIVIPSAYFNHIQAQKQRAIEFVKHYKGLDGEGASVTDAVAAILTGAYGDELLSKKPLIEWDAAMQNGGWRVDLYITTYKERLVFIFWTDFNKVEGINELGKKTIEIVEAY